VVVLVLELVLGLLVLWSPGGHGIIIFRVGCWNRKWSCSSCAGVEERMWWSSRVGSLEARTCLLPSAAALATLSEERKWRCSREDQRLMLVARLVVMKFLPARVCSFDARTCPSATLASLPEKKEVKLERTRDDARALAP
jgi:hypothetical protein